MYGKDTAKPLWEELFMVKVPQLSLLSAEDISRNGMYTTGDKGIDGALHNQWRTVMIPISRMVELYQEGSQIRVINEIDTKRIYELITDHLVAWENMLTNGINIGDAPVQDLIDMDNFASAVYVHARHHFTQEMVDSILGRQMAGVGFFNPQNLFTGPVPTDKSKVPDMVRINAHGDDLPQRESMSDFFKSRLVSIKRV